MGRRQRGTALAVGHGDQPNFPPPFGIITTAIIIIIAISVQLANILVAYLAGGILQGQ